MTCADCEDTGYQPDGTWCTCPARPFEAPIRKFGSELPDHDQEVVTRAEHARLLVVEDDNYTAAVVAIDELMQWCRSALGPVIRLGTLSYHAEHAAFDLAAPLVLHQLDRLEAAVVELPHFIRRLRSVALDQIGDVAA